MTATSGRRAGPIPARAGIGLRAPHTGALLRERPCVGWLEAHSENYFGEAGAQIEALERLRDDYPLSLHGVGLSLGSCEPLDRAHLASLKRLVQRVQPHLVSEHLSWSGLEGRYANDLLPLPYTEEALAHMVARVGELQDHLGRSVLIENVSSYVEYRHSTIEESEFLIALARESGCGILLDVNNVYVSACNHGWDPSAYLARIPGPLVGEIHLAGHSIVRVGERRLRVDTHSTHVSREVWQLYAETLRRVGPVPTLIEWDADLPPLEVLAAEARRADICLERARELAA